MGIRCRRMRTSMRRIPHSLTLSGTRHRGWLRWTPKLLWRTPCFVTNLDRSSSPTLSNTAWCARSTNRCTNSRVPLVCSGSRVYTSCNHATTNSWWCLGSSSCSCGRRPSNSARGNLWAGHRNSCCRRPISISWGSGSCQSWWSTGGPSASCGWSGRR